MPVVCGDVMIYLPLRVRVFNACSTLHTGVWYSLKIETSRPLSKFPSLLAEAGHGKLGDTIAKVYLIASPFFDVVKF